MKFMVPLIIIVLLIGCQNSTDSNGYLGEGDAMVKIDNEIFYGAANLSYKILNEHRYETITLELGDSINVEILADRFHMGIFEWNNNISNSEIIFSLQYRYFGGTMYYPDSGRFIIQEKTFFQITGKFNLKIHDLAASCMGCPGTYQHVEGEFKAIKK